MNFIEIFGRMFDRKTRRPILVDSEGRIVLSPITESDWFSATITKAGTSSNEVDLGYPFTYLRAIIPTLDTATVKIQVAEKRGGTYYNLGDTQATASGTHNYATTFKLGGYRFIKLVASAAQTTAEVECRVSGIGGV